MRLKLATIGLGVASAAIGSPVSMPAEQPRWSAFVIDHFARRDSRADASFLLDGPAGKHGFVQARDGHLFFQDGTRLRCWGVNLTGWTPGSAEIPPHHEADVFSAELARLGVNCVRLHFLDMPDATRLRSGDIGPSGDPEPVTHTPVGLIDSSRADTSAFNAQQLDHLDYFFAQLKKRGIYSDFNLNVGHTWKPGDNVPDAELIGSAKGETYVGPELIALQKHYAKLLLGHRNPYTGLRYADDPAVSAVEIVNENSLLEFWMRNWFRGELTNGAPRRQLDFPPHYLALLTRAYNEWLQSHRSADEIASLRKETDVSESAPVALLRRQQFDSASPLLFRSQGEFLIDAEARFLEGMRDFLRKDIGVKAPIVATADHSYFIPGQPLLETTQHFDIVDAHVYWQHPAIFGQRNTPMVNDPDGSILQRLSRSAMIGKPFTVSEVNEPFPHEYDAEQIPILAAYASLQDWDGVFFYTFESKLDNHWSGMIGDHFDMTEHPTKIAQLPVGAMMFLRGDVARARETVTRSYSREQVLETMRMPMSMMPSFTPGYPARLPLVHETRISCLDCKPTTARTPLGTMPITSDTGELRWWVNQHTDGLVTIDTPRSQAVIGFVRRATARTTNLTIDVTNPFAAITLSSLDGKPISHSDYMLMTTTARAKNTGMIWNDRHTVTSSWGEAPTLIEPVSGWLQFRDLVGVVGITAVPLDGAARPMKPITGRLLENGWELPIGATATTTYVVHVYR